MIAIVVIMLVASIGFFGFIFSRFTSTRKSIENIWEENEKNLQENTEDEKTIASNVNDLTNTTLKDFSNNSYSELDVKGERSNKYSFQVEDHEVYKYILAYKDKHNYLFVVQKALYINFFNANEKATAFVPVKYENVTIKVDRISEERDEIMNSAKVEAPTFYLNSTNSSYIRGGYADYNKFVEEKINPLKEQGYTITEK
jgi:hypothetical protein